MKKFFFFFFFIGILIYFFSSHFVFEVIDGDTFILLNGEKIRLLGINAPEKGQFCYEESKKKLEQLIKGKFVFLEKDLVDEDIYGRKLRYVFVGNIFVNELLVKEGYAFYYNLSKLKYKELLYNAEKYARENKKGCLWNSSLSCEKCIGIAYFHYNARGNDCLNPNDEYFVLKNSCRFDCNLSGWKIKDSQNNTFTLKNIIIKGWEKITVYSGCGNSTKHSYFLCKKGKCKAIWDNFGDTLFLYNLSGNLILRYSYR